MTYVWNLSEDMPTKDGMAITHDYAWLFRRADWIILCRQEELQAAQTIAEEMNPGLRQLLKNLS